MRDGTSHKVDTKPHHRTQPPDPQPRMNGCLSIISDRRWWKHRWSSPPSYTVPRFGWQGGGWILTGAHNQSQKTSSSTTECQFQSADDGSTPTTMMNTYTDAQQTQMERGGCRDARCVTVRGWEVGASTHVRDMSWVVEPVLPPTRSWPDTIQVLGRTRA